MWSPFQVVMESGEIVLSKWLQRQQERVKRRAGQVGCLATQVGVVVVDDEN
jgi:hypothetical protein